MTAKQSAENPVFGWLFYKFAPVLRLKRVNQGYTRIPKSCNVYSYYITFLDSCQVFLAEN